MTAFAIFRNVIKILVKQNIQPIPFMNKIEKNREKKTQKYYILKDVGGLPYYNN